ncbi:MAG TPA: hypothetical protein VFD02_07450 [Syntrophomonadaceae bacterium]|nr:hypothetical protein [Syntrophomonadaceae bacterium]
MMLERDKEFSKAIDEIVKGIEDFLQVEPAKYAFKSPKGKGRL